MVGSAWPSMLRRTSGTASQWISPLERMARQRSCGHFCDKSRCSFLRWISARICFGDLSGLT
eukprot:259449-Pyramimonas_sp.AAC.1